MKSFLRFPAVSIFPMTRGKNTKGELLRNGALVETVKSDMGFADKQMAIKDIEEKLDNALGSISIHVTSRYRITYKKKDGGTAYTDYEDYKQSGY